MSPHCTLRIDGMLKSIFPSLSQIKQPTTILIMLRHELSQGALNEVDQDPELKTVSVTEPSNL